jgi:hypothetical protein
MPPRSAPGAVVRVLLQPEGPGKCPTCNSIERLITIKPVVEGESGRREEDEHGTCWACIKKWLLGGDSVELVDVPVLVTDVIDPSKERARARARNAKATKRELKAAEDIGGSRNPGSGSGGAKGDARNDRWMVEDKHTENVTLTLQRSVLLKAMAQASKTGRYAVIRVGLGDGTELAIAPWTHFAEEVLCD